MTYPLKFREKALKVQQKGYLTYEQTAKRFQTGVTTLARWHKMLKPISKRDKAPGKISHAALPEDVHSYSELNSKKGHNT